MMLASPFRTKNNEQLERYMSRRPGSFIAHMLSKRLGYGQESPLMVGSNNTTGTSVGHGIAGPLVSGFGGGQGSEGGLSLGSNNSPTSGNIPSFAAGGMMGADGNPVRPGMPIGDDALGADAPPVLNEGQIDSEAQRFVAQNPQAVQQIQTTITYAMQSGELTQQELNMAVQLAKVALANPAAYPQVRKFAIENGLGTDADLPQEIDKGLLFTLLVVGKTMKASGPVNAETPQGTPAPDQGTTGNLPEYKNGGTTGDKAHVAKLHKNEYVIPEKALLYHGKKHFDKLVEQAMETNNEQ